MTAQLAPTQTLQAAFEAFARRDWQRLAAFVAPAALDSLRQESLGLIILQAEQRKAGQDVSGGYNPNEVVIADHLLKVGSERASEFPYRPTIAELAALSPMDFFVRWCDAVYRRSTKQDPVREVVGLYRRLIGDVRENDDLALVLYRREARWVEMSELQVRLPGRLTVMPLKKIQNQWRLLLNDDLGSPADLMALRHRDLPFQFQAPPRAAAPATPPPPQPERVAARPSPAETVQVLFTAFDRGEWNALAALVHQDRLVSFQREQISHLIAWNQSTDARAQAKRDGIWFMVTIDDSLLPETVEQMAHVRIPIFPRSQTIGELTALLPSAFFALWCETAYGDPSYIPGGLKSQLHRRIIGQVIEDDTLAHVVYRSESRYAAQTMPLKWSGQRWLVLLNDDIGWIGDLAFRLDPP